MLIKILWSTPNLKKFLGVHQKTITFNLIYLNMLSDLLMKVKMFANFFKFSIDDFKRTFKSAQPSEMKLLFFYGAAIPAEVR